MSHLTHMNESCQTFESVMSHIQMSHTYAWDKSHRNESCHTYEWVMSHRCDPTSCIHLWHDASMCATWLIHMCPMTHSCMCHDSFICLTWLVHMCDITHYTCDMTHPCVRHDLFMCVPSLIHKCPMTHSYVSHDSFVYVPWRIRAGDSFICEIRLIHTREQTFTMLVVFFVFF